MFGWLVMFYCCYAAAAAQCDAVFPSLFQSHAAGTLTVDTTGGLFNDPDKTYEFVASACNKPSCQINNIVTAKIALPPLEVIDDFPEYSGNKIVTCTTSDEIELGEDDYTGNSFAEVSISHHCELELSDDYRTYYFDKLTLSNGAKLYLEGHTIYVKELIIATDWGGGIFAKEGSNTLHAKNVNGQYDGKIIQSGGELKLVAYQDWLFSGNFEVDAKLSAHPFNKLQIKTYRKFKVAAYESVINVVDFSVGHTTEFLAEGLTTLNVNKLDVDLGNSSSAFIQEAGSNEHVEIYARGAINIAMQNKLKAAIYAEGDLTLTAKVAFSGVASAANVSLTTWSSATYDSSVIPAGMGGSCDAPVSQFQCPVGTALDNGLQWSVYKTNGFKPDSPQNAADFQRMVDRYAVPKRLLGSSILAQINEPLNFEHPHGKHQDNYLGLINGAIYIPNDGVYEIAINGDDATELWFAGSYATGYYGTHSPASEHEVNQGKTNPITRTLTKGWYQLQFRHHEFRGWAAQRLYWRLKGEPEFKVVPAANLNHCAPATNHYRIEHDGEGISCLAEAVTIKACANQDCSELRNDRSVVQLSPAGDWQQGDVISFTGATTVNLWGQPDSLTQVAIRPSDDAEVRCYVAGKLDPNCGVYFARSGLQLSSASAVGLGCQTQQIDIAAVASNSGDPRRCDPLLVGAQTLQLTSRALRPAKPLADVDIVVTGAGDSTLNLDPISGQGELTVEFDQSGRTQLQYLYNDVGQFALAARLQIGTPQRPVELSGETEISLIPDRILVTSDLVCPAADSSCEATGVAQKTFDLSVIAACYQPQHDKDGDGSIDYDVATPDILVTRNFSHDSVVLKPQLLAPIGGAISPTSSKVRLNPENLGRRTVDARTTEVGVFQWLPDSNQGWTFLGYPIAVESRPMGRFTPAYLKVDWQLSDQGKLASYCGPMSYRGQTIPFAVAPKLALQGYGASDDLTENYIDEFWRIGSSTGATETTPMGDYLSGSDGAELVQLSGLRLDANPAARTLTLADLLVRYDRAVTPKTPYSAQLDLTVESAPLTDQDGICVRRRSTAPECESVSLNDIAGTQWRDGRLALQAVYGHPEQSLSVPVQAQYYNGSYYQLNGDDSCSVIDPSAAVLWQASSVDEPLIEDAVSGGGQLQGGQGSVTVANDGKRQMLTLEPWLQRSNLSHLQWWWPRDDSDHSEVLCNNGSHLCNPQATITFGRYRGNDRVIYRRELR
ncbi:DUF6701 domain-containing protein [Ferrimonas senticii]|uniref:DUF6701 domain-containing protein n=1 Tax=Ferrimonas senticii TaxID=394566 RepID=UPI00146DF713|nr:DUF6701 domain-containing protein [Ferrimonas senticii]